MDNHLRMAKAHSALFAAELERLGWTLVTEFREEPSPEPYEYYFEWRQEGPSVSIDWEEWRRRIKP